VRPGYEWIDWQAFEPTPGGTNDVSAVNSEEPANGNVNKLGTVVPGGKRLQISGNERGQVVRLYVYELVTYKSIWIWPPGLNGAPDKFGTLIFPSTETLPDRVPSCSA
jgi:hypothetical protein